MRSALVTTLICGLFSLPLTLLTTAFAQLQPDGIDQNLSRGVVLDKIGFNGHQLHYAIAGDQTKPGLIFLHGTPGSWQAFNSYLQDPTLQQAYFMVSVDRLGWGKSKLAKGNDHNSIKLIQSFSHQASSVAMIMDRFPLKKWVVVGHSLGASIAPKLALIRPNQVRGLLLLAGSLKPSLGRARWYNLAANTLLIKWMLPRTLRYSNEEIMVLQKELKIMETELSLVNLNIEVIVIQGMKDQLVSPKNARYVEQHWLSSFSRIKVIEVPKAGHFLPWKYATLIKQTIREFSF